MCHEIKNKICIPLLYFLISISIFPNHRHHNTANISSAKIIGRRPPWWKQFILGVGTFHRFYRKNWIVFFTLSDYRTKANSTPCIQGLEIVSNAAYGILISYWYQLLILRLKANSNCILLKYCKTTYPVFECLNCFINIKIYCLVNASFTKNN